MKFYYIISILLNPFFHIGLGITNMSLLVDYILRSIDNIRFSVSILYICNPLLDLSSLE